MLKCEVFLFISSALHSLAITTYDVTHNITQRRKLRTLTIFEKHIKRIFMSQREVHLLISASTRTQLYDVIRYHAMS